MRSHNCPDMLMKYIAFKNKRRPLHSVVFFYGGDGGSRTHDLLNAIQALSQLSYTPV